MEKELVIELRDNVAHAEDSWVPELKSTFPEGEVVLSADRLEDICGLSTPVCSG